MAYSRYDDLASHYDVAMRPLERWLIGGLRRRAFSYLPSDGRLLEIGAGTGVNFAFYPTALAAVALEPSSEMLKVARQKDEAEALSLVQGCAEHLPFSNSAFDAALATLVFCSVKEPVAAFSEVRRVVKGGGTLILLEHVRPNGFLGPLFDLLNLLTTACFEDHFNRRTASTIESCGLTITNRETRVFGIFNLIVCRV